MNEIITKINQQKPLLNQSNQIVRKISNFEFDFLQLTLQMKTVQFHRNKEELRDELLLSLIQQDKPKNKYKNHHRSQSKQDAIGKNSLSKQKQKQKIKKHRDNNNNDNCLFHQQDHQANQAPRIKLKLKKKTQCQINKQPPIQTPTTSKLSQHIKKVIQHELLSSYYNSNIIDKSKQIDNRKTAYRQDEEKDEESGIGQREFSRKIDYSGTRTKDRQERCLKILQERNNKVINSFMEENSKEESMLRRDGQLKRSVNKFIPENQVYIPKSFITFTVRRNHQQQNESKQNKPLKLNNSSKNLFSFKESQNSQVNTINKRLKQNNRSLSNQQFYSQNDKQTSKKMEFYNRDKKSWQKGTSLKREIKQSSIKRSESVNKIQTQEGQQIKERGRKETRCVTQVERTVSQRHLSEQNMKVSVRKQREISMKDRETIRRDDSLERSKNKTQVEKRASQSEHIQHEEYKPVIPLVKMTESKYEAKSSITSMPQQHQQSISFTSSLNYSTPFPSIQHSSSKQLTINKLSTITKKSQHGLPLSPSPSKQEETPLKFTQAKEDKKQDILRASLTKFKQYEKKKEEIEKQRPDLKVSLRKQKQPKVQLQNLKGNEEFNDFDEIFLQAKDSNTSKIKIEQQKQYQKVDKEINRMKRNKQKSQKTTIVKDAQPQEKELQPQHQITQSINASKPDHQQLAKHPSVKQIVLLKKEPQELEQQTNNQPKPLPVKGNHQLPQLSIQQSSIQKSVSDFTPQPSLADIRINDEPLLLQVRQQKQKQSFNVEENVIQKENTSQQQQPHEKSEFSIDEFIDYHRQEDGKYAVQKVPLKKTLKFDDFEDWKYGDKRDNVPENVVANDKNRGVQALNLQTKRISQNKQKRQRSQQETIKPIAIQKGVKEEVGAQIDGGSQQVTSSQRPKSTTSKVRLIENIELSSSQSQSQSQKQSQESQKQNPQLKSTSNNNNIDENHSESTIQNRYYSSSDQQEEKQKGSQETKVEPRKQKKLTLQKESSMKRSMSNTQTKVNEKAQVSKQKVIPLGIKITKPTRDLFPVLQDSQEWNHGSQSIVEIERKSFNTPKSPFYLPQVSNLKNQTSILSKTKKGSQQKIKIDQSKDKDAELDLLEKEFSQPGIKRKSEESMNSIVAGEKISKKKSEPSKSLSDFSQSMPNDQSSNVTQQLSDFSRQQPEPHQVQQTPIITKKTSIQASKMSKPSSTNINQLNQIQKQRHIVQDLKAHVNSLLQRIHSQHSIPIDQDCVIQNMDEMKSNEKNNQSSQPQIKPIEMSHSASLVAKQSFVEEYEQNNVKQSIVKSKNQNKQEKSRQSNKAYKKYERNDYQTHDNIDKNPLFDFSDKNSSDHQQKRVSSVKKYSKSGNESNGFSSKYISESQKNSQVSNKDEILQQFDNIAKQSQKDFSKNKSYYLKHKQNGKEKKFDAFDDTIQILMPSKSTKNNTIIREPDNSAIMKKHESKTQKPNLSDGSSGQTTNHRQLQVVPESLYITNARNTSSTKIQPRDSLRLRKGLSVSKKLSSNSFEEEKSLQSIDKKSKDNDKSISEVFSGSQSDHNQPAPVVKQKGLTENQSLWNFIMKK